ncbi:hypothetical protein RhoFasB10_04533 [Rhodococcus sp. B10]|nr:hypothetical protein [Rhodococcus sp. B10]
MPVPGHARTPVYSTDTFPANDAAHIVRCEGLTLGRRLRYSGPRYGGARKNNGEVAQAYSEKALRRVWRYMRSCGGRPRYLPAAANELCSKSIAAKPPSRICLWQF